jgi:hypothetical protein
VVRGGAREVFDASGRRQAFKKAIMGCSGSKASEESVVVQNPGSPRKGDSYKPTVFSDTEVNTIMAAPRPRVFFDVSIGECSSSFSRARTLVFSTLGRPGKRTARTSELQLPSGPDT